MAGTEASPFWIFGYGSLLWRPDFPYVARRPAILRGWARRFWQASPDHRGVPEAPGRVVTLVAQVDSDCCGLAFRVAGGEGEAVLKRLDARESGGFERTPVRVEAPDGEGFEAITYVAGPHNANFLGPTSREAMARQVLRARGRSGSNAEYVSRLAAALRSLGFEDEHVFELADCVDGTRSEEAGGVRA